jgi:SAM-dependent methyltransferase
VATRGEAAALATAGPFDVCVLSDVIEHARDPKTLLEGVARMLARNGTLLISTPSVAHWSARILGRHWMEFKEEHLFYFDPRTTQRLLDRCGYDHVVIRPSLKRLNLDYLAAHFQRFHVPLLRPAIGVCHRLMPAFMRRWPFSIRTGGIVVMARAQGVQS